MSGQGGSSLEASTFGGGEASKSPGSCGEPPDLLHVWPGSEAAQGLPASHEPEGRRISAVCVVGRRFVTHSPSPRPEIRVVENGSPCGGNGQGGGS